MPHKISTTNGFSFFGRKDQNMLDAGLKQGVILPHSCKNGQCGACKIKLLEGKVSEIRPQHSLSEEERSNKIILSCCNAPISDITIETEDLSALHGIEVKTVPCRIQSITHVSSNVVNVRLRLHPNTSVNFLEGQYLDIIGPNAVRRSYSIANDQSSNEFSLFIKKVKNGVLSNYWFNHAKVNDLLRLEGPKGTFFLRKKCKNIIFLATGAGIAPIIAMLDQLEHAEKYDDDLTIALYWGNRYPEEFFWQPEYKKITINYTQVISRRSDSWSGEVGYVQDTLLKHNIDLKVCEVYACGSPQMITSTKDRLITAGLLESRFFSDAFISS